MISAHEVRSSLLEDFLNGTIVDFTSSSLNSMKSSQKIIPECARRWMWKIATLWIGCGHQQFPVSLGKRGRTGKRWLAQWEPYRRLGRPIAFHKLKVWTWWMWFDYDTLRPLLIRYCMDVFFFKSLLEEDSHLGLTPRWCEGLENGGWLGSPRLNAHSL